MTTGYLLPTLRVGDTDRQKETGKQETEVLFN
jgi:hypothetical protein